jgi:hypothetical protein
LGRPWLPWVLWSLGLVCILFWSWAFLVYGKFNDGGWYTCAAQAVLKGLNPYTDFYYPHTLPYLYFYSALLSLWPEPGVFEGRILHILVTLFLIGLVTYGLYKKNRSTVSLILFALAFNPYVLSFLFTIKSYAFLQWLLFLSLGFYFRQQRVVAYFFLGLACHLRISFLPLILVYAWVDRSRFRLGSWAGFLAPFLVLLALPVEAMSENLFLPVPLLGFEPNAFNQVYFQSSGADWGSFYARKAAYLLRSLLLFLPFLILVRHINIPRVSGILVSFLGFGFLGHLIAVRPYEEYLIPLYIPLYFFLFISLRFPLKPLSRWAWFFIFISLGNQFYKGSRRLVWPQSQLLAIQTLHSELAERSASSSSQSLCFDGYFNASGIQAYPREVIMGRFSRFPGWKSSRADRLQIVNASKLKNWFQARTFDWILLSSSEQESFFSQDPQLKAILKNNYRYIKQISRFFELPEETYIYARRKPRP